MPEYKKEHSTQKIAEAHKAKIEDRGGSASIKKQGKVYFVEYSFSDNKGSKKIKERLDLKLFRNSAMVDDEGNPTTFYHGSKSDFVSFDKKKIGTANDPGWLGYGFYFYTEEDQAVQYGKVKEYYLNIENPYYATYEENKKLAEANSVSKSKAFTKKLISERYDGVYFNGNLRGETVVFEPNQIFLKEDFN